MNKFCTCEEMLDRNRKKIVLDEYAKYHNCSYVRMRSGLVPEASRNATDKFLALDLSDVPKEDMGPIWNKIFTHEMETMVRQNKIISMPV